MKTLPSYTRFTKVTNGWISINNDNLKLSAIEYIAYETEYVKDEYKTEQLIGVLVIHTHNHIYKYRDNTPATVKLYMDDLMKLINKDLNGAKMKAC